MLPTARGSMRLILQASAVVLPWPLRRLLLMKLLGYELHPTSRIGFSWVYPRRLLMGAGARIDHLTVCKSLDYLEILDCGTVGRLNWIYGAPDQSLVYRRDVGRRSELKIGRHAAITNRHIIDCTNSVSIGAYATLAGYRSQVLTHSIDLAESRQSSSPIEVGDYSFVGTACVLLGGSVLPKYSILGAGSLLNRAYSEPYTLYAGVPARPRKRVHTELGYFRRQSGFVL